MRSLIYLKASPTVRMNLCDLLRLIAMAGFALSVATSAQGMTPVPLPQPDDITSCASMG